MKLYHYHDDIMQDDITRDEVSRVFPTTPSSFKIRHYSYIFHVSEQRQQLKRGQVVGCV